MKTQKQAGFAVIEAVLIVVVLALLGGVGYYVVAKNGDTKKQAASQTVAPQAQDTQAPTAEINSSLESAAALEAATIDESTTEIDKSVDAAVDSASNVGDSFNENEF